MAEKKTVAANKGSNVDPGSPVYKNASGYKPAEKINSGLSGAGGGKVSAFHGQNSDEMGAKDKLVEYSVGQKDPYRAKASEFPVNQVNEAHGQGESGAATWENRNGGGKDKLAEYTENQCGPRHVEDDGPGSSGAGTPVGPDRSSRVASAFSIGMSKGESESRGGQISVAESVNLMTGKIEGPNSTSIGSVPDHNVTL